MKDTERIGLLQRVLLNWFAANRRPLPWRETYSPYATWIAEVMLQQTQMERGVSYFLRWMERFPTVQSVAEADDTSLLKAWEGLGYYSRARNIKKAAQALVTQHGGALPQDMEALKALPGIGPYTAGAIASTAFNMAVPCVDGNVERVLSRVFDIDSPVKAEPAKSRIRELAEALIPQGQARDLNQSLMEFGALVCRKKPLCGHCPVCAANSRLCESLHVGVVDDRPVPGRKVSVRQVEVANGLLVREGKVFVQQRENEGVWAGLWEFPGGGLELDESPEETVVREWREEVDFAVRPLAELAVVRHAYTSYRVTLHCFSLELVQRCEEPWPVPAVLTEAVDCRWVSPDELDKLPMPAPHRKIADRLFGKNADLSCHSD